MKLTEEDGDVLHSCNHRLKAFELDILDDIFLISAVSVLYQPLKKIVLCLKGSLIQDGDGVPIVHQRRQLSQIVLCHLRYQVLDGDN